MDMENSAVCLLEMLFRMSLTSRDECVMKYIGNKNDSDLSNTNVQIYRILQQATIILVGYFILGPSDLYKLTKEIGKFIQNFRALGAEATKTLETNMESQLQLDEIRKAQRELNDAFSFRRTINVDDEGEAFSTIPSETRPGAEPIVQPSTDGKKKRKKVRRRKVVVDEEEEEEIPPRVDMESVMMNSELGMDVPDLDMSDVMSTDDVLLRQERMERLKGEAKKPLSFEDSFSDQSIPDELDRFSQQLSGDWNARIMANEAKLEPLALLMERLAILEDEKNAADARLEEEFRLRAELEEKYYKSKRQILEEAAAKVQEDAYVNLNASDQAA